MRRRVLNCLTGAERFTFLVLVVCVDFRTGGAECCLLRELMRYPRRRTCVALRVAPLTVVCHCTASYLYLHEQYEIVMWAKTR